MDTYKIHSCKSSTCKKEVHRCPFNHDDKNDTRECHTNMNKKQIIMAREALEDEAEKKYME